MSSNLEFFISKRKKRNSYSINTFTMKIILRITKLGGVVETEAVADLLFLTTRMKS
jgi:hypothetical protein